MIDYINGYPAEVTPTYAVLDCNGLGYEINITLIDYPEISTSEKVKLFIHESIREDAHLLFGFLTRRSRELFRCERRRPQHRATDSILSDDRSA